MKLFVWVLFIIFLVAFQGSPLNPFVIGGIRPDLVLIAVYFLGFNKGDVKGAFMGASLGFLIDIISAGPLYYQIFSKCSIGYLSGIIGRWIQNPGYLFHASLIFSASLLQGAGIFIALTFLGMGNLRSDLLYIALPQAIFDGLLGATAYFLFTYSWKKESLSRWA